MILTNVIQDIVDYERLERYIIRKNKIRAISRMDRKIINYQQELF
jgi:hypothetical protein